MKRTLSLLLAVMLLSSIVSGFSALGAEEVSETGLIQAAYVEELTNEALSELYDDETLTEKEIEVVEAEVLDRLEDDGFDAAMLAALAVSADSSEVIKQYVTLKSYTISSDGNTITVNYDVIKSPPTTIKLERAYPAITRISSTSTNVPNAVGSYSYSFSSSGVFSEYKIRFSMSAGGYDYYYDVCQRYPRFDTTNYHVVTQSEVTLNQVTLVILGLATSLNWKNKVLSTTLTLLGYGTLLAVFDTVPNLTVDQYHRTRTYLSGSKLYTELTIWHTKVAYDRGDLSIYSGTTYVNLPSF